MGPNPKRCREMQEPYPSPEVANDSISKFCEELEELRVKHHVAQVLVIAQLNVLYPPDPGTLPNEPEEGTVLLHFHMGDQMHAERMAAWAFGKLQSERQELIASVAEKAARSIRGREKREKS